MSDKIEYRPINCSYYDVLESHATIGDLIEIVLKTKEGNNQSFNDRIINLEARNGEEFVIMESGNVFRLDTIVSINGESPKQPPYNLAC